MQTVPVAQVLTRYSTAIMTALVAAAQYWMGLTPEEQKQLLAAYPMLIQYTPAAGGVLYLAAKFLKQKPSSFALEDKPEQKLAGPINLPR